MQCIVCKFKYKLWCAFILRRFLFILILVCSLLLQGEEKVIDGFLFNSIYDEPEGRNNATSLTISSKRTISYEKNLTIELKKYELKIGEEYPLSHINIISHYKME